MSPSTQNPPGYYLLTETQIQQYYTHISLPAHYQYTSPDRPQILADPSLALPFLNALIRHHASSIPFENLTLHYDRSHTVTLAHDTAFNKALSTLPGTDLPRNRGGYCLENNGLLLCVLRSLGFHVYPTGARINKQYSNPHAPAHFESWGHLVNLVTIDGKMYMADVGLSLGMPCRAIPLASGEMHNHGTFSLRLRRGAISEITSKDQEMWIYSAKFSDKHDWLDIMCFSTLEFIQDDFERMNFYINHSRRYWMTSKIIVSKLVISHEEDADGEVVGLTTLTGNVVKHSVDGVVEKVVCETEEQRVAALEKYFGIRLTREERRGIEGLPSALRGADLYAE